MRKNSPQYPERMKAGPANIFRKRGSVSGLGAVQSVKPFDERAAIKLWSFHRSHGGWSSWPRDPRQRTPNKYRSSEIEDTRNREAGGWRERRFHRPLARREKNIIPSAGTSFCLRLLFFPSSRAHKARSVLRGTTHN